MTHLMGKQRIVFRADGSGKTGYGHFIRSLALAGYLKDDFDCHFTTYNSVNMFPTDYQFSEIAKVCDYIPIVGRDIDQANTDFINELKPDDIVVLDNYYYTTEYQQTIEDKGCKLVCIDDIHDRHMVCDLLITPCPLRREDFSLEPYTKFVGGIEWAFLREPFLKPSIDRNISQNIKRVVIAMGGADPFNLTDKMIKVVCRVLPKVEIHVMVGDTVSISEESVDMVITHKRLKAEEIVELFDISDMGIFPASTVCMEAFSRLLPVAGGYYVDNQKEFYEYCVKHNLFSPLGNLLDDSSVILKRFKNVVENDRTLPAVIDFRRQKEKIIQLFKELESE